MQGAYPDVMARTAELIENELPDVDFVDINMGCPIDNVCHKYVRCRRLWVLMFAYTEVAEAWVVA